MDKQQVLIVDDDPRICRLIRRMAGSNQFEYTELDNPGLLRSVYEDVHPDKIFLDLSMPEMDGIEAMTFLQEIHSESHICLISGKSEKLLRSSCGLGRKMGLNMSRPMHKPFSRFDVRSFLEAQLIDLPEPSISLPAADLEILLSDLRSAVENGVEIHPFYQPIVDLRSGRIHSLEVLCRWYHPVRGIVGPEVVLALAEQDGLMQDLTYNLLLLTLDDMLCWDSIDPARHISINLFPTLLEVEELPDIFIKSVLAAGIDPSRITFEITEHEDYGESIAMLNVLSRLRLAGFGLSLDDFGTGFASMEKVRNIPFTELKVDKSFVGELLSDPDAKAIVKSSINLAREIGVPIVAEGIEDKHTLDWLIENGCDRGQGYLFGHPCGFEQATMLTKSMNYNVPSTITNTDTQDGLT